MIVYRSDRLCYFTFDLGQRHTVDTEILTKNRCIVNKTMSQLYTCISLANKIKDHTEGAARYILRPPYMTVNVMTCNMLHILLQSI